MCRSRTQSCSCLLLLLLCYPKSLLDWVAVGIDDLDFADI